jgi:hypothetical protein
VSSAVRILLAASLTLILGACGASKPAQAPASQAAAGGAGEAPTRAEIARLWDEIDGWRGQAGMAGPDDNGTSPMAAPGEAEVATSMPERASVAPAIQPPDAACPVTVSEPPQCRDSCTLATSICSNAERICRLAEDLAGDDWAAGKCSDAAGVCRQATADCCDCRAGT